MAPEQINELFETMALGLRTNAAGGAPPADGRTPAPAAPVKPAEPPPDFKKLLDPTSPDFDPEGAFKKIVEKNYGSLVGDLSRRTVRGLYAQFQQELGDFNDYQAEVDQILAGRDPTTLTEKDVLSAYFTAKGMKSTIKERAERAAKKGATTMPPSAPKEDEGGKKPVQLSAEEKSVAQKMFSHKEDPEKEYADWVTKIEEGPMVMKVPIGGGKKE